MISDWLNVGYSTFIERVWYEIVEGFSGRLLLEEQY
jgi:hypothetical protein